MMEVIDGSRADHVQKLIKAVVDDLSLDAGATTGFEEADIVVSKLIDVLDSEPLPEEMVILPLLADTYRKLKSLGCGACTLVRKRNLANDLMRLMCPHFSREVFCAVLRIFSDVILLDSECRAVVCSSSIPDVFLGLLLKEDYEPTEFSLLLTCAAYLLCDSCKYRMTFIDSDVLRHLLSSESAAHAYELCFLIKSLLRSTVTEVPGLADIIFPFLCDVIAMSTSQDTKVMGIEALTRLISAYHPIRKVIEEGNLTSKLIDDCIAGAFGPDAIVAILKFIRRFFARRGLDSLKLLSVDFLNTLAGLLGQRGDLAYRIFREINELGLVNYPMMVERLLTSEIFGTAVASIDVALYDGAGAAALLVVSIISQARLPASDYAYRHGFDLSFRFLLESDREPWRIAALDALEKFLRTLVTCGEKNKIMELREKDWLWELIRGFLDCDCSGIVLRQAEFLIRELEMNE
jgi:hypothetical protein